MNQLEHLNSNLSLVMESLEKREPFECNTFEGRVLQNRNKITDKLDLEDELILMEFCDEFKQVLSDHAETIDRLAQEDELSGKNTLGPYIQNLKEIAIDRMAINWEMNNERV